MSDDPHQRRRDARDIVKEQAEARTSILDFLRPLHPDEDEHDNIDAGHEWYESFEDLHCWDQMTSRVGAFTWSWVEIWVDQQMEAIQLGHVRFATFEEYHERLQELFRRDALEAFPNADDDWTEP